MKRSLRTTLIIACALFVSACAPTPDDRTDAPDTPVAAGDSTEAPQELFAEAKIDAGVTAKWARTCALCHVEGLGGAPRVGMQSEWQARVEQGEELLLNHTIEGFNDMPPLGYCMSCEREDMAALIKLMAGGGS